MCQHRCQAQFDLMTDAQRSSAVCRAMASLRCRASWSTSCCSESREPTPILIKQPRIPATRSSHISTNGNGDGAGHEETTWARLPKFVPGSVSVSGLVRGVAGSSTLNLKRRGGSVERRSFPICFINSRYLRNGYRTQQARCLPLLPFQAPSHTCSKH